MDPLFEGENIPDTPHPIWGNQTVKYLDDSELEAYEITVENGKIVHAGGDNAGKLFDTSEAASHASGEGSAIFVMTPDGKIYASHYHEAGAFHHSSLSQGKDIAAGGELVVENGTLKEISNQSGHYEPSQAMNDQLMEELKERGLNTDDSNYILRTGYGDDGSTMVDVFPNSSQGGTIPESLNSAEQEYIPKYWWKDEI